MRLCATVKPKLKSATEWRAYSKSGKKPENIPGDPWKAYAGKGWTGIRDWLGAEELPVYVSFKKGRAYARNLGLKTQKEWIQHCKSGKKPKNIPAHPTNVYGKYWRGYGDWLATGTIAPHLRKYLSFKKARAYVRSLNIKGQAGWKRYKKPDNIPAAPWQVYAKEWIGMFDWLGSGQHRGHMRPFPAARTWARQQGLKSKTDWFELCKSGKKPEDIPANPQRYPEWTNWGDFLGTGTIAPQLIKFASFKNARAFARRCGLKSKDEWFAIKKPNNLPSRPDQVYAKSGWKGWSDFLDTERQMRAVFRKAA